MVRTACSARRTCGPLRHRCSLTGATGAVGLFGGGDPILVVYRPAAVRLPHPRHGNVYPADPVRLANVHTSPPRRLPAKSIPTVLVNASSRSQQGRKKARTGTLALAVTPKKRSYELALILRSICSMRVSRFLLRFSYSRTFLRSSEERPPSLLEISSTVNSS
jgi:hypothetical protein